ncbi:MAG: GNAT family N-acetyltransferase [Gammaproteobacteria bacterium]
MSLSKLTFYLCKWEHTHSQITRTRKKVFMDEQHLPLNFLRHKDDEERYHVVAYDDLTGQPVGTGCIHDDGHIGRIAILKGWRETNSVAHVIVDYLMHVARSLKVDRVWLNAPVDSLDFYSYRDFYPMGEPFDYCGVPMQKLELWREVEDNNKIFKSSADITYD